MARENITVPVKTEMNSPVSYEIRTDFMES